MMPPLGSSGTLLAHAGVFWPKSQQDYSDLTGTFPFPSSDHRLVYVNVSP